MADSPYASPPSLGYGQRAEAPIDAVNQWMRSQPWYQSLIRSFGQDPNNVHLNDAQKQAVIRAAQANGVIVDEGHNGQEVDDSGNFQAKSHALRNTLIVAGIAAAALATAGAAGAFGGAAAGGGAASGAGAAGAGTAGTLAGIEGGAYGLDAAALASLGGGAGAAGAAGAGAAGAAGAWDAAGNFIGPSTVSSVVGPSSSAGLWGLSSADLLRYGLPVAGGIAGSLINAHAASSASEAEQRYLEEALAYQKAKDKQDFDYRAAQDTGNIQREGGRYSDYQGNIAPYVAGGQAANARMLSLLGLSAAPAALPARQTAPAAGPMPTGQAPQQPPQTPMQQPQAPPAQEPMITVQSPDGQTQQFPASTRPHWEQVIAQKGGQILQGAA